MPDIAIARPFCFRGSDGIAYEFGVAVYTNMSPEFCSHWYVQSFTEAAVRARGGKLVQTRALLILNRSTGLYEQFGNFYAPILLDPAVNPQYTQVIEPQWAPLFNEDIDSLGDIERPPPETGDGTITSDALGMGSYRMWGEKHNRTYHGDTLKVRPGDPSPPVGKVTDPDRGRVAREEREHRAQQVGIARAQVATVRRFVDSPPDPKPIPYRRRNPFDTDRDAREVRRRAVA